MSRKKITWSIIVIVLLTGGIIAYKEYNRKPADISRTRPHYTLSSGSLIQDFEKDEAGAGNKYNGKVIEIFGPVKDVERDERGYYTVVMRENGMLSSARCSMDTLSQDKAASFEEGMMVRVRGVCTGFNKDDMGLGSDVILNRCVVVEP